jgi:hypothetical protein
MTSTEDDEEAANGFDHPDEGPHEIGKGDADSGEPSGP